MKTAFTTKVLALSTLLTTLVYCAPVDSSPNVGNIFERDNRVCMVLYGDTDFHGEAIHTCSDPNVCYNLSVPDIGVSSIQMADTEPAYCLFWKGQDCKGDAMVLIQGQEIADLNAFGAQVHSNWNDQFSSFQCGARISQRELDGLAPDQVSNTFEKRDDTIGVRLYQDTHYDGFMLSVLATPNKCWKILAQDGSGNSFGLSSIQMDPAFRFNQDPFPECKFYLGDDCQDHSFAFALGSYNLDQEVYDLNDYKNTNWNDNLSSAMCVYIPYPTSSRRALSPRAPTNVSTTLEKRQNQIGLSLYQDTHYDGFVIGLSAKPNACWRIVAQDGSGGNFGLSSIKMDPIFRQHDNDPFPDCEFFTGLNCEMNTFAFTLGYPGDENAYDLNDYQGKNWNNQLMSAICVWSNSVSRRRDLNPTTELAVAPVATQTEFGAQDLVPRAESEKQDSPLACVHLWSDPNFQGTYAGGCFPLQSCYAMPKDFGLSSIRIDKGDFVTCKFYNWPNYECASTAQETFTVADGHELADLSLVQIGATWYDFDDDMKAVQCY